MKPILSHPGKLFILFSTLALLSIGVRADATMVSGYATLNGGTTGGGGAAPVTVSTMEAFKKAVGHDNPAVVIIEGRLNIGDIRIGSNKTIIGADAEAGLYGGTVLVQGTNYIFKSLSFGPSKGDAMEISGATNVFITHCEFHDSTDEL
jgi:pectate lyase